MGKSTLSAALALLLARQGRTVLAVDADPDANLAASLGVPAEVRRGLIPIARQIAMIEERTGAKVGRSGQIFKLNPEVSDIADNFALRHNGVALLVLGAVARGGGGCACPENMLLKALVSEVVLHRDDALVMDMEAGIEHLGRGTTRGVEVMVVVVEPGQRAVETARRIFELGGQIGLRRFRVVANKIATPEDQSFVQAAFPDQELLGVIPYTEELRGADREGRSVLDGISPALLGRFQEILEKLEQTSS